MLVGATTFNDWPNSDETGAAENAIHHEIDIT